MFPVVSARYNINLSIYKQKDLWFRIYSCIKLWKKIPLADSFFVLMIFEANSRPVAFWTHLLTTENAPLQKGKCNNYKPHDSSSIWLKMYVRIKVLYVSAVILLYILMFLWLLADVENHMIQTHTCWNNIFYINWTLWWAKCIFLYRPTTLGI